MKPPPPPPVWINGAPQSMAPTPAKPDSTSQRAPAEISGPNYNAGCEAGKRYAYTRLKWALTILCVMAGIGAWLW